MEVVCRWRKLVGLRYSVAYCFTHIAPFHSTPVSGDRWSKKSGFGSIKFTTRQKRADAKKALNDLLLHCGASKNPFQPADRMRRKERIGCWNEHLEDEYDNQTKKNQSKSSYSRAQKAQRNKMKRKLRREKFADDDEYRGPMFHATYGNKFYEWPPNNSFRSSTMGFDWRQDSTCRNNRFGERESDRETESDDEESYAGFESDRRMLGLPPDCPLKMEDVKNAFRLSALKWHPDRHQGPTQAAAEEKFKLCVDAYKSLCSALSTAA